LPDLAPVLRKAYPHLTVIWSEDKTHILVHALQSGVIDAALLALEAEIGDVEREVIAKDPFVLWRRREIHSSRKAHLPRLPNCAEQP
jgi:LysR family hydrogen peroxide-inducible transcriptional activator